MRRHIRAVRPCDRAEASMSHACILRTGRSSATALIAAWLCCTELASGQIAGAPSNGLLPLLSAQASTGQAFVPSYQPPNQVPRHAPLARLIETPDQTDGAPPYALADQTGTIQRYVEPVPGINLASHVGQVVKVRLDTGSTLLASQIELPAETIPR